MGTRTPWATPHPNSRSHKQDPIHGPIDPPVPHRLENCHYMPMPFSGAFEVREIVVTLGFGPSCFGNY